VNAIKNFPLPGMITLKKIAEIPKNLYTRNNHNGKQRESSLFIPCPGGNPFPLSSRKECGGWILEKK